MELLVTECAPLPTLMPLSALPLVAMPAAAMNNAFLEILKAADLRPPVLVVPIACPTDLAEIVPLTLTVSLTMVAPC